MIGYLEIEAGGDRRLLPLREDVIHIGRGLSAEVRLDDATVSRKHAVIVRRDDAVVILDDRSMNGVWVDGERVTEAPLSDGSVIMLGRVSLRFRAAVPEELSPEAAAA
jgi:pSer/pThr/pTyr-binding forkhead associated (FHA) protein